MPKAGAATRSGQWFVEGLSPRAGMAALRAAKARALMARRHYVAPDDLQAILPQAIAHRLTPVAGAGCGAVEQVRAMIRDAMANNKTIDDVIARAKTELGMGNAQAKTYVTENWTRVSKE